MTTFIYCIITAGAVAGVSPDSTGIGNKGPDPVDGGEIVSPDSIGIQNKGFFEQFDGAKSIQSDSLDIDGPYAVQKNLPVRKSPTGAMLRSAVVPGWGQLYNGKWFKAILVAGAEIGLVANAVIQNQLAVQANNPFDRAFYEDNRSLSIWWLGAVILYSMGDAYVDAHLYRFDESPRLSLACKKLPAGRALRTDYLHQIRLSIPLN